MIRFLGARGASAVMGIVMLVLGANPAAAQTAQAAAASTANATVAAAAEPAARTVYVGGRTAIAATPAVATVTGTVMQARPASSVTVTLAPEIAREAQWLQRGGWPLYALVDRYSSGAPLDAEAQCIAIAVYHEARGESLDGQLAVARVIMNRAASGRYPTSWCGVVKQPWQFSFVNPRTGAYPTIDESSSAWAKALGVTRLAVNNVVPSVSTDVLWYHADYVAPSWGRRLTLVSKIGTHIFYKA